MGFRLTLDGVDKTNDDALVVEAGYRLLPNGTFNETKVEGEQAARCRSALDGWSPARFTVENGDGTHSEVRVNY